MSTTCLLYRPVSSDAAAPGRLGGRTRFFAGPPQQQKLKPNHVPEQKTTVIRRRSFPTCLASRTKYFVHGPMVRYVHLPKVKVDTDLLQDGARKEAGQNKPGVK